MPVRPAMPRDEQAMASVCTAAWFHEDLFGSVMHPFRHQYPNDVSIYWHQCLRRNWRNSRTSMLVAVTVEEKKEKVIGVAVWQRQGDDEGAKHVERNWLDVGEHAFAPLASTHNRALDPSKRNLIEDSFPYFQHHWRGDRSNNWYLALCGVHPSYQNRGFGRELVHWGLDLARAENVHASVISSLGNSGFYLNSGFDEVVGDCTEHGSPMREVRGGDILFMWPKIRHQSD